MANTNQDRVLEALADLVPAEAQKKVATLVTSLLDEAVAEIQSKCETEYTSKLEEGYRIIAEEREKDLETAENGYNQAYNIIADLRARLARQEEEFQETLEEQYGEAYKMIQNERSKNENLEATLYEDFDHRTQKNKEYIVEKCDEFLTAMGEKYYELVRREVLNDPCTMEHRLAFEKILEVAKDYLSDEDIMLNTGSKIEELQTKLETVEVAKRQIEQKAMRLMTENSKMHEYLKETKELIENNILNEQNERLVNARNVEGRGKVASEPEREVRVIGENVVNDSTTTDSDPYREPQDITEQWQVLAGISKDRS